jgi:small subunit ribosomal protein S33
MFDLFALQIVGSASWVGMSGPGLSRYIALAGAATSYARRITHLRNRIFGEVVRPTAPQSQRVVKLLSALPAQQNPEIVKYYPRHVETHLLMRTLRHYGLFR